MKLFKQSFLVLAVALLSIILTVSCSKDDDFSIKNTKWELDLDTELITLEFISDTDVRVGHIDTSDDSKDFVVGTYTYNHPIVTLTPPDAEEEDDDEVLSGTVSGNTMTFDSGMVFTKK